MHLASVRLYDVKADAESQPRISKTRRLRREKRVEDLRLDTCRYSRTIVADGNFKLRIVQ